MVQRQVKLLGKRKRKQRKEQVRRELTKSIKKARKTKAKPRNIL